MLELATIMNDTLWVAKMQGWRDVGTYDEIGHLAQDEDCRDFDLAAKQPAHLEDFYKKFWAYDREHGFITVQDYYNEHYKADCYAEEMQGKVDLIKSVFDQYKQSYSDIRYTEMTAPLPNRVMVDITWGDWKHDHLRADYLVQMLGGSLETVLTTEEDGSDCYSATRVYTF